MTADPSGAGTVYVKVKDDTAEFSKQKAEKDCGATGWPFGLTADANDTHNFSLKAETAAISSDIKTTYPYLNSEKYRWSHWEDDNGTQLSVQETDYTVTHTDHDTEATIERTVTAYWLLPAMTENYTKTLFFEITDPTLPSESKDATFEVSDCKGSDDFYFDKRDTYDNISLGTATLSASTITLPITYIPTGIHNMTGTVYRVYGASKFLGSNSAPIERECTITVTENYEPSFELPDAITESTQTTLSIPVAITNVNKAAESASWEFTSSNTTNFEIAENSTYGNLVVNFSSDDDVEDDTEYTTKLTVTATYTDKVNNQLYCEKTVVITVTLQPSGTPILNFSQTDAIEFNTIYPFGDSKAITIQKAKVEDIVLAWDNSDTNETTSEGALSFVRNNLNVTIALNENTLPGEYNHTLSVSGNSTIENTEAPSATITVKAKVSLKTPTLQGFPGNGCVYLQWDEVPGATEYLVEWTGSSSGSQTFTNSNLEATISQLENTNSYSFTVTAVYKPNETYNQTSNLVEITPQNIVTEITSTTAPKTGIWTGTEHEGSAHPQDGIFPYMTKRNVDVSAAFDGVVPLFDKLVIYGLTTNKDNISTNGKYDDLTNLLTDAVTPCYIYNRDSENNKYILQQSGNTYVFATNMNISDIPTNYDISGETVYFTGYCPSASTSDTWNNENDGVINAGSLGKAKEIYIDNLQIYSRSKNSTHKITSKEALDAFLAPGANLYAQGSGAAIVIYGEGKIHISGSNILQGYQGMTIHIDYEDKTYSININETRYQYSAPIQCNRKLYSDNSSLQIDDIWKVTGNSNGKRTNGKLKLATPHTADQNPMLVDLSNNTTLSLAGGQIFFDNTAEKLAIGRSYDEMTIDDITLHGVQGMLGNDNSISFKDGTYDANAALVCSDNLTVDGGNYICDFAATEIDNSAGKKVYKITANITSEVATIVDGLVNFDATGFGKLMDEIFPKANYMVTVDGEDLYASLKGYYSGGQIYGHNSIATTTGTVGLMLPKDAEASINKWVICRPTYETTDSEGTKTYDGSIMNDILTTPEGEAVPANQLYVTSKLLYTNLNENTCKAAEENGISITSQDHYIATANTYTISDKLYMLIPIVAGEWKMIASPFNVHNIYVIEAYPEDKLKEKYGTQGKYGTPIEGENVANAQAAQTNRMFNLIVNWIAAGDTNDDFFGLKENTYGSFVNTWMNSNLDVDGYPMSPVIEQLYHYTGKNGAYPSGMKWWNANYYLYKSKSKIWNASTDAESNSYKQFNTDWEIVTEQSVPRTAGTPNVVMQRGEIYTMQFPSVVGTTAADWNYWTGKYILLEGYGPQDVYGSSNIAELLQIESPSEGTATLAGNASFAKPVVTNDYLYYVGDRTITTGETEQVIRDFVKGTSKTLLPCEGLMIANLPTIVTVENNDQGQVVQSTKVARAISMETGDVIYEVSTEVIDNNQGIGSGVPTIMGDLSLIVEPTAEGLCITPIKEQQVMLFDAGGKMIFSKYLTAEENVTLPTGVYVVRGEYEQVKAIKK